MMSRIKHISVTSDVSSFQQLPAASNILYVEPIDTQYYWRWGRLVRFRFRCPGSVRFRRAVSGFGSVPAARGPGSVRFPPRGVRVRFGSPIRGSESVRCRVRFGMYNRTRGLDCGPYSCGLKSNWVALNIALSYERCSSRGPNCKGAHVIVCVI